MSTHTRTRTCTRTLMARVEHRWFVESHRRQSVLADDPSAKNRKVRSSRVPGATCLKPISIHRPRQTKGVPLLDIRCLNTRLNTCLNTCQACIYTGATTDESLPLLDGRQRPRHAGYLERQDKEVGHRRQVGCTAAPSAAVHAPCCTAGMGALEIRQPWDRIVS